VISLEFFGSYALVVVCSIHAPRNHSPCVSFREPLRGSWLVKDPKNYEIQPNCEGETSNFL
jgi:hypothetical protein